MESLMPMLLLATRDRGCSVRFEWDKSTFALAMKIKSQSGDITFEKDCHVLIENLRFTEGVVAAELDHASFGVMQARLDAEAAP